LVKNIKQNSKKSKTELQKRCKFSKNSNFELSSAISRTELYNRHKFSKNNNFELPSAINTKSLFLLEIRAFNGLKSFFIFFSYILLYYISYIIFSYAPVLYRGKKTYLG